MYLPKQFEAKEPHLVRELMRENAFATLISVFPEKDGTEISQLPIVVPSWESSPQESGFTLLGHLAKPNTHCKALTFGSHGASAPGRHQLLFSGPNAYMSPSVYPDLLRVPTWSYLSVLVDVSVTIVSEHIALDRLLKKLIAQHELPYATQWLGLDPEFQGKLLNGIVGFEFEVTGVQAKFKLNQHRPESHQAMYQQLGEGSARDQALAVWMKRLGMV